MFWCLKQWHMSRAHPLSGRCPRCASFVSCNSIAEITTALLLTAPLGCGTVTPVLYDSTWQGGQPW